MKVQLIFTLIQFTLKDAPGLKVFDADDISFATNSPIQITNNKEFRTRSVEVRRPTKIEKVQKEYEKTYALTKSIKTLELSAIAKFWPYDL